jgi:curved DNA-binding protein CbpA
VNRVPNAYRVLQVDQSADFIVIHAAYRALARRYHPDGDAPDAERMSDVNRAYAILRDPEERRRHDDRIAARITPVDTVERPRPTPVNSWAPRGPAVGEHAVLDFGRYMGWRISDLARQDPDYLLWLSRHSSGLRYRGAIARVLPSERMRQGRTGAA